MNPRGGRNPGKRTAGAEPLLGVVFDFDGVIADTEPLHLQACQDVLRGHGMTLSRDDYQARYLGFDDAGVFTAVASDRGLPLAHGELHRMIESKERRFAELIDGGDVVFPDAPACIERLAGKLVLGIASGALRREIETILGAAGLRSHFSAIVGADDVEHAKPAPDGYSRAVELLSARLGRTGSPSRFIAIEDSRWGIEAAARRYLGKAATALTLDEIALLAAIPPEPGLNPWQQEAAARRRQAELLREMRRAGLISAGEAAAARARVTPVQARNQPAAERAADFSAYAQQQARAILDAQGLDGERLLARGGLRIVTTLDLALQERAECLLQTHLGRLGAAAAIALPCPDPP